VSTETTQIFDLMRKDSEKASERHTEVCQRLTALETSQPTQPCVTVQQLGVDFRNHVDGRDADRRTILGTLLRYAITGFIAVLSALAAVWSQK